MDIGEHGLEAIADYASVPISFWVRERYRVRGLELLGPEPVVPWFKDYDACPEDRPASLVERFDPSRWGFLGAWDSGRRVGGAILVFDTPEVDLLEGRDDLVHVFDFRVCPSRRSQGVGRALWSATEAWSATHGATELRVETQDVNVPACRFYRAMGCRLLRTDAHAYGNDEVQLIWGKRL